MPTERDQLEVIAALERDGMADQRRAAEQARRLPSEGRIGDFLMGAGSFIAQRTPGIAEHMQGGPLPPDTTAANVGGAAPGIGLSFLVPGAGGAGMLAQGGLSAGLEALNPDSSKADVVKAGALSAAFTGVADLAGRAVSGIAARARARYGEAAARIVKTQSERLRTIADNFGGLGQFNAQQQGVITKAWVRAIGEKADDLAPEVRQRAAERIGKVMDEALPKGPVDITEAYALLDEIPGEVFPGKSRLMTTIAKAETSPEAYQNAMRLMRDGVRNLARAAPGWADEAVQGMNLLAEAGEAAGAANTRVVREQYKNLMSLEAISTVRRTGQVPALSAEQAIFSKYGPGVSRRGGEGLLPETVDAIQITQAAAGEAARRFRSSGTAERGALTEATQDAMGLMTGATNPSQLVRSVGTLLGVGPLAGLASQGAAQPLAGRAGAAVGNELAKQQ